MVKIKLDLQKKTDEALRDFAAAHIEAMEDNTASFPEPDPSAEIFDTAFKNFRDSLAAITANETQHQSLLADRERHRKTLEEKLQARGGYIEKAAEGDEAKILSSGIQLKSAPTSISSLPAPEDVSATMGDSPGEIDLSCHRVPRAKTYVAEVREHSDTTAPGPWRPGKLSGRSSMTIPGLTSGQRYSLRLRVLGPHDIESPWSPEVICMAP